MNELYGPTDEFVDKINSRQSSWTAGIYKEYESMTIGDLIQRSGKNARRVDAPRVKPR